MKKFTIIVLSSAALALAGCDNNKGSSSDQYNNGSGADSTYNRGTVTNLYQDGVLTPGIAAPDSGVSTNVPAADTNAQGAATSPGHFRVGAGSGTSYPVGDTNSQGAATSPRTFDGGGQPVDPKSTNAVPNK